MNVADLPLFFSFYPSYGTQESPDTRAVSCLRACVCDFSKTQNISDTCSRHSFAYNVSSVFCQFAIYPCVASETLHFNASDIFVTTRTIQQVSTSKLHRERATSASKESLF